MPMWPTADSPALDRVVAAHREATGVEATHAADAPATWLLMGEHVDYAGGVVLVGQAAQRVAVAFSPRQDDLIRVTRHVPGADADTDEISTGAIAERAAGQQSGIDARGRTTTPPAPEGGLAARLAGIVWTMIHRQLLSRDTAGLDVTVVDDIPAGAGLGANASLEAAFALALQGDAEDIDDAPMRARLAEVCAQAAEMFSEVPPLRARHTTALRGVADAVSVIDYADGSVTHAPHPLSAGVSFVAVAVPGHEVDEADLIRERREFLDNACHAFGAESLRLLPDAPQRVLEWLRAVHKVHGTENQPTADQAAGWLSFHEAETRRAQQLGRALRSRRIEDVWPLLAESEVALTGQYGLTGATELVQLCNARGALGARAASAGTSAAVIAGVDKRHTDNFTADLSADGLLVVELGVGGVATLRR
mgnify:CR=1 FL=1